MWPTTFMPGEVQGKGTKGGGGKPTVKGGRPGSMWPTALMPERERRWPAQVSVMLTMATVMGPSAPTVFSFLHMQAPQHAIAPSAAPACLLLRSLCTP